MPTKRREYYQIDRAKLRKLWEKSGRKQTAVLRQAFPNRPNANVATWFSTTSSDPDYKSVVDCQQVASALGVSVSAIVVDAQTYHRRIRDRGTDKARLTHEPVPQQVISAEDLASVEADTDHPPVLVAHRSYKRPPLGYLDASAAALLQLRTVLGASTQQEALDKIARLKADGDRAHKRLLDALDAGNSVDALVEIARLRTVDEAFRTLSRVVER
jgi:hypothetical protein